MDLLLTILNIYSFSVLTNSLNRAAMKYDNLLVINDLNKKKENENYFF